ncbi:MAG: PSD1 and planctomycete cytochrome C domain-containing protein [Verrucomicrobiota bacterium]
MTRQRHPQPPAAAPARRAISVRVVCLLGTLITICRAADPNAVDFGRDILPILSNNCFHCHGPDDGQRKAKLRLDTREGLFGAGKSDATAVVPGRSDTSELILRVTSTYDDEQMPPPDAKEKLHPRQIALLKRWVEEGAPWGRHWAYVPPPRGAPPAVRTPAAGKNPIDAFVRARLEREGLAPSPETDRRTLHRRLSLDLLGLPPAPQEVAAFVANPRPDAYERLVDTLLASPHFGERWGRHWLDLARYADSAGYLNDTLRPYAYLYRDWVINAVNRDQPFDQFTIEQLAGDLLPAATLEQKIATGFHRNALKNDEAGADLELDRTKAAVDRTATTGAVWLGLTVGCAECHAHKYDPISHREFYQLYAFFNRTAERDVPAPRPDELAAYNRKQETWEKERQRLASPIADYVATLVDTRVPAWETQLQLPAARWHVLAPTEITHLTEDEERTLLPNADHSVTTGAKDPVKSRYVVQAPVNLRGVTGFRLEALADLGEKAGRSKGGDFALAEFSAMLKTAGGEQRKLEFAAVRADFAAKSGPAEHVLDGDSTTGWSIAPQTEKTHVLVFELKAPQDFPAGSTLYFDLEHRITGVLGRFRLAVTTAGLPLAADPLPDAILAILDTPAAQRTAVATRELAHHVARFADARGQELFAPLAAHLAKAPEFPKTAAPILVTHERKTRIHLRGDYQQTGEEVEPGTPAVLPPLHARGAKPDRLDLARWLVDPANPLPARVTVNHVWKHLFGRGLVATVDNFGALGERPSHPELLDFLATEFVRLGWSRKQLIRLIVTSATYRQSSAGRAELVERDPLNVLLARQSRHRLEAETVRDVFLAGSGLLNPRVGGPSIHPPLPAFVMAFGRNRSWPETTGPERYRRGMYIHLRRNVPYPMLATFDASDASVTCLQRERSNSPLQALTLLNDPVFFECSAKLGAWLAGQPGDVDARLRAGFERCLARPPTPAEQQAMRTHFDDQLHLAGGDQARAYLAAARLIMNLDEFITRE